MAKSIPYANPISTGNDPIDYFMNPLGALTDNILSGQAYAEDNGDGTVSTYGKLGKKRHTGSFSPNNPYVANMMAATSNQDQDALYELAVKWEADYANTLEERAYNSPEAQLARERAAGINSDISAAGSSAGGSGVTSTGSAIPQQQGQTKFSNTYDEVGLTLQGIQTAASVASAFGGASSAIAGAISIISMLPSQIGVNNASSNLANTQANAVNQLLPGQKDAQQLSNAGQMLTNAQSHVANIERLSRIFGNDATDESMTSTLGLMGIPQDSIAGYIDSIKQYRKNPYIQAWHNDNQTNLVRSQSDMANFTRQYFDTNTYYATTARIAAQKAAIAQSNLDESLTNYLVTFGYAEQKADEMVGASQTIEDQNKLARDYLRNDIHSFAQVIKDKEKAIADLDAQIAEIDKKGETRKLQAWEKARRDQLEYHRQQINSARHDLVYNLYDTMQKQIGIKAYTEQNTRDNGKFKQGTIWRNRQNEGIDVIFQGYLDNKFTSTELGDKIFNYVERSVSLTGDIMNIGTSLYGAKLSGVASAAKYGTK